MDTRRCDHLPRNTEGIVRTVLLAVLLASACELFAQAGGGGSYSGGGGSGGAGGGNGDGFGWIIYMLIRLTIQYPAVGVPVLVVGGVVLAWGSKEGWFRHQARTIRRGAGVRAAYHARVSTEALKQADPGFRAEKFLGRVGTAFLRAQDGWCAQNLERLRPFVSDGVYERFLLQVEEQKREGWRQGLDDLAVETMTIVDVHAGAHFDTLTVKIPFKCRIHRISLKTGDSIPGSTLPDRHFVECWSFLRRRGAKTLERDGLIEGLCPNCSTPLRMNAAARCESCRSLLRSGEFDWVLAEITQACEWEPEDTERIAGLEECRDEDPGLNVQHLEDRASVMFWRKAMADTRGSIEPLRKIASDEFCEEYAERLRYGDDGLRTFLADCAVGTVRTTGLFEEDGRQRAIIEVRWDGRRAREVERGQRTVEDRRVLRRSVFVLKRKAGSTSDVGRSITSSHCPSCGAPDEGGTGHACDYCGKVLNTGDLDWVLEAIHARGSPEGRSLALRARQSLPMGVAVGPVPPLSAVPPGASALAWLVKMAFADGELHPDERQALEHLADKCDVPRDRLDSLLAERAKSSSESPEPGSPAEARQWLESMVVLAAVDGSVSRAEMAVLKPVGAALGYSAIDLRNLVRRERARLYRESRQRLREERRSRA